MVNLAVGAGGNDGDVEMTRWVIRRARVRKKIKKELLERLIRHNGPNSIETAHQICQDVGGMPAT
jgi:hypothetical protein